MSVISLIHSRSPSEKPVRDSAEVAIQADSLVSTCRLAETGMGLAVLPCYLGDRSPALRRLTPPLEAVRTGLWILTHEDLRRTARIRAFMEFVGNALQSQRRLIEGAIDGSRPVE